MTKQTAGIPRLPRQRCERLRQSADFERVRAKGRTCPAGRLLLQVAPNQLSHVRFGVITSKRLGKAVRRNRVRRLVREAIRTLCPRIFGGYDLVIVARSTIVDASLGEVKQALEGVLSRAGILDGPPVATASSAGGFPFKPKQPTKREKQ